MSSTDSEARTRYQAAVAARDAVAELRALEDVANEALGRGETLAVPRLIEEALALCAAHSTRLTRLERARTAMRLVRLWAKSGLSARKGADPSKYWFFRT